MGRRMRWLGLIAALVVILAGAELFTNGVEWVGKGLGLSEGVVGSVLAAIGTALPETLLPIVAILSGRDAGADIGIGAILGAPFMLATLAMFFLGLTVVIFSRLGRRSPRVEQDPGVLAQDLTFFLAMYSAALVAGELHTRWVSAVVAVALIVAYGVYVRRHLRAPGEDVEEREAAGEVRPLYAARAVGRSATPAVAISGAQTAAGLAVIVAGAQIFVRSIAGLADQLGVSHLAFALLLAPVATELPEALNSSAIWARRGKDVLALGNITGAMVFQSTFPVAVGLLFTSWRLDAVAGVAAGVTLIAALALYAQARLRGRLVGWLLLAQGTFYAGYVAYVLTRI
jgi:cation:H+ antiporter